MDRTISLHRRALLDLVRAEWDELWIATTALDRDAVALLLPELERRGRPVRLLLRLSPDRLAEGEVDLDALNEIRMLPDSEVRTLPELTGSLYAAVPGGPGIVTAAPLTLGGLDGIHTCGLYLADGAPSRAAFARWWDEATPLTPARLADLVMASSQRVEARTLGDEITRVGAFVRVSVRGTRRSRRLDPRDYGVTVSAWGRAIRPVEVSLYRLDDLIRAKEELEAVLDERGLEWNGYYLVPRSFLEQEWPGLFAARERHLRERLHSLEGQALLKEQLGQARQGLEAFFTELYPNAETGGMAEAAWVDLHVTRVLAEAISGSILEESGLEYRVLTILPEDGRSVEELHRMLQDPKLRSVQLTFHF